MHIYNVTKVKAKCPTILVSSGVPRFCLKTPMGIACDHKCISGRRFSPSEKRKATTGNTAAVAAYDGDRRNPDFDIFSGIFIQFL